MKANEMTHLTKQKVKDLTDQPTANAIMAFLQRSTVSAIIKNDRTKQMRKGKLVDAYTLTKHYDVDQVIAYCTARPELSNSAACISVCKSLQRGMA